MFFVTIADKSEDPLMKLGRAFHTFDSKVIQKKENKKFPDVMIESLNCVREIVWKMFERCTVTWVDWRHG